ncbi:MAG TPA: DUF222 domain-containing protein [Candidatus Dormibacteraeota bacterium]|nr:DUF222 domain-containing protein [Candidatus Dormibacteraeota bacterium]
MAASGDRLGTPLARIKAALDDLPGWLSAQDDASLGEPLIEIRGVIDRSESVFADGVRRFDKSGEYRADGALSLTDWLRWKCKLSGGAALERVEIARQLEQLPKTEAAFATGDLGYQHVVVMARAAAHVGAAAVRQEEASLLQAAQTMDPGTFTGIAKNFEHRVDAAGALAEANHAYQRRYLHIGEPVDGLVRLDGVLDAEGGATLRTALQPFMKPVNDDARSYGQRGADALMALCRQGTGSRRDGAGPRPQLIIRAGLDTLAGAPGAPAGELDGGGTVPAETVQRHACDSALIRITGQGELDHELTHASRTIPASTRRALESRDQHCVFPGCSRPTIWCDGHHLVWWIKGGLTTLPNLALLCRPHHRMVHEEGWRLVRHEDGGFTAIPPPRSVMPNSRSA